jgi:hypothetical protein
LPDGFLALPQSSICAVALESPDALSNSFGYGAGEVNIMKIRVIAAVVLLIPAALLAQAFRTAVSHCAACAGGLGTRRTSDDHEAA